MSLIQIPKKYLDFRSFLARFVENPTTGKRERNLSSLSAEETRRLIDTSYELLDLYEKLYHDTQLQQQRLGEQAVKLNGLEESLMQKTLSERLTTSYSEITVTIDGKDTVVVIPEPISKKLLVYGDWPVFKDFMNSFASQLSELVLAKLLDKFNGAIKELAFKVPCGVKFVKRVGDTFHVKDFKKN